MAQVPSLLFILVCILICCSSPSIASVFNAATSLPGIYECHLYDGTTTKNDWHYVNITRDPKNPLIFKWKNKAGVVWTLTANETNQTILKVGSDCPYMNVSPFFYVVPKAGNGSQVLRIVGPYSESYRREGDLENIVFESAVEHQTSSAFADSYLWIAISLCVFGCGLLLGLSSVWWLHRQNPLPAPAEPEIPIPQKAKDYCAPHDHSNDKSEGHTGYTEVDFVPEPKFMIHV